MVNNTPQLLTLGSIDDIYSYYISSHGYYLVEFTSLPYNLKNIITTDGQVL